jgi:hypothetical protein
MRGILERYRMNLLMERLWKLVSCPVRRRLSFMRGEGLLSIPIRRKKLASILLFNDMLVILPFINNKA